MAKEKTINEKEVFEAFMSYDLKKLLVNYPFTEEEKKDKKVLHRNLRSNWIDTLKVQGLSQNQKIEGGDNSAILLFFFILKLNEAHQDKTINLPENKAVIREAMKALGLGVNKKGEIVKRGAFLSKQINKSNRGGQLTIFDTLEDSTREKIKSKASKSQVLSYDATVEMINRNGDSLPLSKGHYKLIDTICELLHEKSPNKELYSGNGETMTVTYGGEQKQAPTLALKFYEIAKKYNQDKRVSGKQIEIVKGLVYDLAYNPELRTLIKYQKEEKTNKGNIVVKKVEEYAHLVAIYGTSYEEYNSDKTKLLKKGSDLVLVLNPIFTDQINNIWVEYPKDLVKRSLTSYGSTPPELFYRLRDYLAEQRSLKNFERPIIVENLYQQIAAKYLKEGRKKIIKTQLDKSLEACIKLGLLNKYELTTSKTTGEAMYIFHLNKEWI